MNPELLTLDQEIPAGTVITTGASSAELIKVKVVRRDTETVAIPFDTQNTESDQYDFGKVVTLQEGADGSEEITYETTMIDGAVTDRQGCGLQCAAGPDPGNHRHRHEAEEWHDCQGRLRLLHLACAEL